jgi:serine/threonine protein phosphatase 1
MSAGLTYAVGDIHGSFDKLANLLDHCMCHAGQKPFRFVFVGDYVDRGGNSRDVVQLLMEAQATVPERIVCLRGNHEDMLVKASRRRDPTLWLANGGATTLRSYGVTEAADIPRQHLEWLASLPLSTSDDKRFFVHAGVMPGVPLRDQSKETMLWIREPFLSDPRHHGLFVVHGHTPLETGRPELRPNRLNLDTAACFGGPLTAAVFDDSRIGPLAFLTDDGQVVPAPPVVALAGHAK